MNNRGISGHPLIALGQTPSLRSAVINLFLFTRHTYYFRLDMASVQHKQRHTKELRSGVRGSPSYTVCVCVRRWVAEVQNSRSWACVALLSDLRSTLNHNVCGWSWECGQTPGPAAVHQENSLFLKHVLLSYARISVFSVIRYGTVWNKCISWPKNHNSSIIYSPSGSPFIVTMTVKL